MRHTPSDLSPVLFLFGILALGGCSSSQTSSLPANTADQVRAIDGTQRSWIDPAASKAGSLLYVSNAGSRSVTIYSYNDGNGIALVGELSGFSRPEGLCSDKAGDILVTDFEARRVYEYAHGATQPFKTFTEGGGRPSACAVDPKTGTIAVANRMPRYYREGDGEITLYEQNPKHKVRIAGELHNVVVFSLAYDNESDLFADANDTFYSATGFYEVLNGANYAEELTVPGGRRSAFGGLVWGNPNLIMASFSDYYAPAISKLQVSGYTVQVVQTFPLSQSTYPYLIALRAGKIIVPDASANAVEIYNVKDGSFVSSFTDGLSEPYSAVVSQKG